MIRSIASKNLKLHTYSS